MKVLIVGNGGREHAIGWKISKSPLCEEIFCTTPNAGLLEISTPVNIKPDDIEELLKFAKKILPDLTLVGPELPLSLGIVDVFEKEGFFCIGPSKECAKIETSKGFAKYLMKEANIPTAGFEIFNNYCDAKKYLEKQKFPIVIKADGLAGGKGVIICYSLQEADETLRDIMKKKVFGQAGDRVVVEEYLEGVECSYICLTDGKNILPLATSVDHKRVFDGDKGANTGGMGAISPAPFINEKMEGEIIQRIIKPAISTLRKRNLFYRGFLYAGLILTKEGAKVLEFNARAGDPEIQAILPLCKDDLLNVFLALKEHSLLGFKLQWERRNSCCVVLSSGGYPHKYNTGYEISGLEEVKKIEDIIVFHAGTKLENGKVLTSGGRVLGVTSLGNSLKDAIDKAYSAVKLISFTDLHFRRDIGKKFIE